MPCKVKSKVVVVGQGVDDRLAGQNVVKQCIVGLHAVSVNDSRGTLDRPGIRKESESKHARVLSSAGREIVGPGYITGPVVEMACSAVENSVRRATVTGSNVSVRRPKMPHSSTGNGLLMQLKFLARLGRKGFVDQSTVPNKGWEGNWCPRFPCFNTPRLANSVAKQNAGFFVGQDSVSKYGCGFSVATEGCTTKSSGVLQDMGGKPVRSVAPGTAPAPQWCPSGLKRAQKRRVQRLRAREIILEKKEEERDKWPNNTRPMVVPKKTWRKKRLAKE